MPLEKLKNQEYIYARLSADGRTTSFQVKIRKAGFPKFTKSFGNLEQAKAAVRNILQDQFLGDRTDHGAALKITLREILETAKTDLELGRIERSDPSSDAGRLKRFIRDEEICDYALINLSEAVWQDFILSRLESVKAATVKRELNTVRPFVAKACKRLKVRNELEDVGSPSVEDTEIQRISAENERKIFGALRPQQNPVVYAAAVFSLDTSIRRGECQRRNKNLPLGRSKIRPLGSNFSAFSFALIEPVAFAVHLQNVHVVREPVE